MKTVEWGSDEGVWGPATFEENQRSMKKEVAGCD